METTIRTILDETNAWTNPYFVALRDGSFAKEDFVETQIQFYFAVVFFGRPMAAAAVKIPNAQRRVEILRNVWEEHGEGNPTMMHGETFRTLLARLGGISEDDIEHRALWPEVRAFNTALVGACVMDEFLVGVASLGMIERMFSEISSWIGRTIVERDWITTAQLIHYNLHEKVDVKHAQDFFTVLQPSWEQGASDRYYIEQGLRLGAHIFNAMYEGLHRARGRRAFREVRGPHSRA